jgi:hypothetical protein
MKESRVIIDSQARATGGSYTPKAAAAADVQQSIYTTANGDMIQGSLRIIGDPQFIKQDDVFYPPFDVIDPISGKKGTPPATSDQRLIADGSLQMDNREVYVSVTFKTPNDVSEVTGLANFSSDFQQTSMFSGMYRVLTVKNTFSGGRFEQVLEIVRLPRQTSLEYNTNNQTTQRSETDEKSTVANAIPAPPTTATNNTATPLPEATPAPGNKPVEETAAPVQSAEQKELAKVADTAEEKPITQATVVEEPPAVPPAHGPGPEKLALKATSDQARAARDQAQSAANAALDAVAQIESRIETIRANLDRYPDRVARGVLTQAEADPLIANNQQSLALAQNQLATAQAKYAPLDAANKAAQTAYVNALDAYTRAA